MNNTRMTNTILKPFSDGPHDVLVVCRSEAHMRDVQKAFNLDAQYCTYWMPLLGGRFERIIVFLPTTESDVEKEKINQLVVEYLPTKIRTSGGKVELV